MGRFPLWLWSDLKVLKEGKDVVLNSVPLEYIANSARCDVDGLQGTETFDRVMRDAEIKVVYDKLKLPARADYVAVEFVQDDKPLGKSIKPDMPVCALVTCRITKAYERTC